MKNLIRSLLIGSFLSVSTIPAIADIPVFDAATFKKANDTANTTAEILKTNGEVLQTVLKTLESVTGDRTSAKSGLENAALGSGFSVSSMPNFGDVLKNGVSNFGDLSGQIQQAASLFINGLQLVKSLSGKDDSDFASDQSYKSMLDTITAVSAMVNGSQSAVAERTTALQAAGSQIGTSQDVKGSIDQNSALQVETGLVLNEAIGVLNGQLQSLQAENVRVLTDISNTKKSLEY